MMPVRTIMSMGMPTITGTSTIMTITTIMTTSTTITTVITTRRGKRAITSSMRGSSPVRFHGEK